MDYRLMAAKRRKRLKTNVLLQCNTRRSLINNKILHRHTEGLNSWQKDVWQKDEAAIIFLPTMFLPKVFDQGLHAAAKIRLRFLRAGGFALFRGLVGVSYPADSSVSLGPIRG